jgi:soluble lytic murein transglycosylase-like protein
MPYNRKNKIVVFCSACWVFAFSSVLLAQVSSKGSSLDGIRTASVVRTDARTGRLVRRVVVDAPAGASSSGNRKAESAGELRGMVNTAVDEVAGRYGVDPLLVHSVIRVESNYNPVAVSPKGAEGLMQLIPSTARRFGAVNSFNIQENIEAGVKYLKYLQGLFGDDRLAVAAYNAGESAVQRYRNVPPYPETQEYVVRVGQALNVARQKAPPAVVSAPVPAGPPPPRPVESFVDDEGRVCMRTR